MISCPHTGYPKPTETNDHATVNGINNVDKAAGKIGK